MDEPDLSELAARDAARAAARLKLTGLLPGQTGANFVNEIADAVLDAAIPLHHCQSCDGHSCPDVG